VQVKTKNMIVSLLAVALVGFLWYQYVYSSMENKASKAKTAAHEADTQAKSLQQTLDAANSTKGAKKPGEIPAAELQAALPADTAEPAVAAADVATIGVAITVRGNEAQLTKYISGLNAMKRIFVVDNVAIAGGASNDPTAPAGTGTWFSSDALSLNVSGRIFSQPGAVVSTVTGASGSTTPVTGAPAPTGSSSASGTTNS
jgi:Tfp pilus assembly protein PilO